MKRLVDLNEVKSLIENGSGIVDYYLGKINGKNIIISTRDIFIVKNDGKLISDKYAFNAIKIFTDKKFIKDEEETIVIALVKEAYYDVSRLLTSKIKIGDLVFITYIANEENIKKSIDKKYILSILENEEISYSTLIVHNNKGGCSLIEQKDKKLIIPEDKEEIIKNIKDTKNILFAYCLNK